MKVFISWSGERSKQAGLLLDSWLKCVIQAIDPWMSNKDIDRGSMWFSEISNQLQETTIGIVCLTKENKNRPWILFEAGALTKGISSNRICTFLIDLEPEDIQDPLAQFNYTLPEKKDMLRLVSTLNNSLGDKRLNENILFNVFETYWPQFELEFKKILEDSPSVEMTPKRSSDDLLSEILSVTRRLDKRVRNLEDNKFQESRFMLERERNKLNTISLKNRILEMVEAGLNQRSIITTLIDEFNIDISEARELLDYIKFQLEKKEEKEI